MTKVDIYGINGMISFFGWVGGAISICSLLHNWQPVAVAPLSAWARALDFGFVPFTSMHHAKVKHHKFFFPLGWPIKLCES